MMITDFQYDETNGLICVKRKHSERSMTSFYDGEQLEMEPLSETEAMDLPSELHRFWERDKASVGKITWDKGESLFGYSVFDKENGEKIRYYLQDGSYFCMICRENPQKPWVLRGPAEGKYAWMVYGIERRKKMRKICLRGLLFIRISSLQKCFWKFWIISVPCVRGILSFI